MKPYYQHAGITIYHGICEDVLPLEADLLLTDPPYNFEPTGGGIMGASAKDGYRRTNLAELDSLACCDFSPEAFIPLIGPIPAWVIFTNKKLLPAYLAHAVSSGLLYDVHFLWKNNPTPVKESAFLPELEYIVVFRIPGSFWCKTAPFNDYRKAFVAPQAKGDQKIHPAQKPVALAKKYMRVLCPKGGLVIDPYMGSGTTVVAARELGLRAIGIEAQEKYCELAAIRLSQDLMNFDAPEVVNVPSPGLFEVTA